MAVVEIRTKLLFGTKGHIGRGIKFPGKVRVILLVGIVGITVWGIRLWLVLTYDICIFCIKSFTEGAIG